MADSPVDQLTKLPLAGQLGVAAGLAAALVGAFWWFYWKPTSVIEEKKAKELQDLQAEVRKLEATKAQLPKFKARVEVLEARLREQARVLPASKETPDLVRKVQSMASESSLMIKRFAPAATIAHDIYEDWPITIDVEGTYHNLALFFDRVSRLSRLVNMGQVRISAQKAPTAANTVQVSCVATTYVFREPDPDEAAPAGRRGRARGKKRGGR